MKSIGWHDFVVGLGMLLMLEGLLFAASPTWMRKAMQSTLASPDNLLRVVGLVSAALGLLLIWFIRR
jgi:uncharacterized protein YjeT (DUF2065 family)